MEATNPKATPAQMVEAYRNLQDALIDELANSKGDASPGTVAVANYIANDVIPAELRYWENLVNAS